jgi:hypothetical protein
MSASAAAGSKPPTPVAVFVEAMATDLGLGSSPADRRTRRQLRRLSEWATGEGLPLDREVILDPDTVERFVAVGLAGDRSRATYRAVLRRVGPLLTKRAPWEPRAPAVARRQVAPPYTADEVGVLRSDALHQPTAPRRRAARALLALGLGAGLDGRWVTRVAAPDITRSASGVLVAVGEPSARSVVALAEWEDELADLAATAGDEFLVGGKSMSTRRTGHLTDGLLVPTGHPRLAPARLRSTWLVTHLRAGTRLPELCRAAGLLGVTVLSDLLDVVEPLAESEATAMLRGTPR